MLISKNGASSCYFEENDRKQFGRHLGAKVLANDSYVAGFCSALKQKADRLIGMITDLGVVKKLKD